MNHVSLVGRLTADPQVKQTQTGLSIASFTVAVNKKYSKDKEQKADFIRCKAFKGVADFVGGYFFKGMKIGILGRINTDSYTDTDGKKVYVTEVIADDVEFVERRQESYTGMSDDVKQEKPSENVNADIDDLPFF